MLLQPKVNDLYLEGTINRPPVHRLTPLGREITDIMLTVERAYNKHDYIPCIAWNRCAKYVGGLNVGSVIRISGRVQSRDYIKNGETKTAYEVSINLLEAVN